MAVRDVSGNVSADELDELSVFLRQDDVNTLYKVSGASLTRSRPHHTLTRTKPSCSWTR